MELYGYLVSSRNRIKILKTMSVSDPLRSKDVAKNTGLSWQTTSAELNNMLKYKVVNKEGNGYTLTEKGYFLITRISYLPEFDDWILDSFVDDHMIHDIPPKILKDFGIWKRIDMMSSIPTDYIATEKDALLSCARQYRVIAPNVIKWDIGLVKDQLESISVKCIYSFEGTMTDDAKRYLDEQVSCGMQVMLIPVDRMYMMGRVLDVHDAQISFRKKDREFDFGSYIIGDDEEFVFWCRRNFHYMWEIGTPYEADKKEL